jgi:hypothetical protein
MTAPILQRLCEAAATLSEERVSMQTLAQAHGTAAAIGLVVWILGSE